MKKNNRNLFIGAFAVIGIGAYFVYKFVTKGTVEEKILEMQANKKLLMSNLFADPNMAQKLDLNQKDLQSLFEPLENKMSKNIFRNGVCFPENILENKLFRKLFMFRWKTHVPMETNHVHCFADQVS
jgi:hypothetical protein